MKRIFNKVIEALKYRKILFYSSHVVDKLGIRITPFYLYQEFFQVNLTENISPRVSVSYSLLTPIEIEKIYTHPEYKANVEEQERLTKDYCLCFALTQKSEILSYIWCNLTRCHSVLSEFPIEKDEAYLFSSHTYNKYRGLNLAPYLRYRVYQSLYEMGRSKLYSLTEYWNTPAKKFKKKLKAKQLKLKLYIRLFNIYKREITLKEYH